MNKVKTFSALCGEEDISPQRKGNIVVNNGVNIQFIYWNYY